MKTIATSIIQGGILLLGLVLCAFALDAMAQGNPASPPPLQCANERLTINQLCPQSLAANPSSSAVGTCAPLGLPNSDCLSAQAAFGDPSKKDPNMACLENSECKSLLCVDIQTSVQSGKFCADIPDVREIYFGGAQCGLYEYNAQTGAPNNNCYASQTDLVTGQNPGCCSKRCVASGNSSAPAIPGVDPPDSYCTEAFICAARAAENEDKCGGNLCSTAEVPAGPGPNAGLATWPLVSENGTCVLAVIPGAGLNTGGSTNMNATVRGEQCLVDVPEADSKVFVEADAKLKAMEYLFSEHTLDGNYNDSFGVNAAASEAGIFLRDKRYEVQKSFDEKVAALIAQYTPMINNPENDPIGANLLLFQADLLEAQAYKDADFADFYGKISKDGDGNLILNQDREIIYEGGDNTVLTKLNTLLARIRGYNPRCYRVISLQGLFQPCNNNCINNSGFFNNIFTNVLANTSTIGDRNRDCARNVRLLFGRVSPDPILPRNLRAVTNTFTQASNIDVTSVIQDFKRYAEKKENPDDDLRWNIPNLQDYNAIGEYNIFTENKLPDDTNRRLSVNTVGAEAASLLFDFNQNGNSRLPPQLREQSAAILLSNLERVMDYHAKVFDMKRRQSLCLREVAELRLRNSGNGNSTEDERGNEVQGATNYNPENGNNPSTAAVVSPAGSRSESPGTGEFSTVQISGVISTSTQSRDTIGDTNRTGLRSGRVVTGAGSGQGALSTLRKANDGRRKTLEEKLDKSAIAKLDKFSAERNKLAIRSSKIPGEKPSGNSAGATANLAAATNSEQDQKQKNATAIKRKSLGSPAGISYTGANAFNLRSPASSGSYNSESDDFNQNATSAGLSTNQVKAMLNNLKEKRFRPTSDDSLFTAISKAYVRSAYKSFFSKKKVVKEKRKPSSVVPKSDVEKRLNDEFNPGKK